MVTPPKSRQPRRDSQKRNQKTGADSGNNHRSKQSGRPGKGAAVEDLIARMDSCADAETLNDRVITPFVSALETVCRARGYVLNIYGANTNLSIGEAGDVEAIYNLIEDYRDSEEVELTTLKKEY
ncbi:MAG: hypothetical protein ACKVKG_05985 [Alphaproteobacteria bacterium]|jgi:hypothetical protein